MFILKHLKPLLSNLISLEQTRFVEGRKIMDAILIAVEMIHSIA